jgi:hypothetical protein
MSKYLLAFFRYVRKVSMWHNMSHDKEILVLTSPSTIFSVADLPKINAYLSGYTNTPFKLKKSGQIDVLPYTVSVGGTDTVPSTGLSGGSKRVSKVKRGGARKQKHSTRALKKSRKSRKNSKASKTRRNRRNRKTRK